MSDETAEILALKAVAFIVQNDELRDRFMTLSGIDESMIKNAVQDRVFLISVLEFFVNFEPDLIAFAENEDIAPESVTGAWRALGGGVGQDW
ncbi:DUF3572 domain-containing protein [Kordiimonas aquimaris]|uniref:DUF3572 domain-containing protein n=1 Tax=Kordiimonas aquimaris TaxID=707591 RepID=UPI0021D148EA|nr:DUF3572 domain-containing protein [Kordiimonas aquimaris]